MTGCVSICVKNLAKVAKVTEWVGRKSEHNNDLLLRDTLALSIFCLNFICGLIGTILEMIIFVFVCVVFVISYPTHLTSCLDLNLWEEAIKTWRDSDNMGHLELNRCRNSQMS